jgi:hypothetical protein
MSTGIKIIYHQSRQVTQTRSHIASSSILGRTAGAIASACIEPKTSSTRLVRLVVYAPSYRHLRQLGSHGPAWRTRESAETRRRTHVHILHHQMENLHSYERHEERLTNTNKLIFIVARFIAQDIQALSLPLLGNFHKYLRSHT